MIARGRGCAIELNLLCFEMFEVLYSKFIMSLDCNELFFLHL